MASVYSVIVSLHNMYCALIKNQEIHVISANSIIAKITLLSREIKIDEIMLDLSLSLLATLNHRLNYMYMVVVQPGIYNLLNNYSHSQIFSGDTLDKSNCGSQ